MIKIDLKQDLEKIICDCLKLDRYDIHTEIVAKGLNAGDYYILRNYNEGSKWFWISIDNNFSSKYDKSFRTSQEAVMWMYNKYENEFMRFENFRKFMNWYSEYLDEKNNKIK